MENEVITSIDCNLYKYHHTARRNGYCGVKLIGTFIYIYIKV